MRSNGTYDFGDFLNLNPIYKKYEHNPMAREIYDRLSEAEYVQKMIWAIKSGKVALSGCITDIESEFKDQSMFDLKDRFTKTCLGAMVKTVLAPFGYTKVDEKRIPKGISILVQSASTYALTQQPTVELKQVLTIERL
ncbi:MAG TPA: hypothetical protein DEF42_09665 [Desulfosporosinus sp.]|nr:hypothetical protein [Desulfosporosinus sp.]